MCPVHCMMVLAPISLSNGWCMSKICIHYHCVNIRINSLGCNANSFDPWSRHIGLPSDPRIGDFNGWNFCYAWINICTMIHQKSGHNTWCRHHIEILISNSESTSVLAIYNMLHVDKVSLMPFLEILTMIAVARDTDQILIIPLWGCKLYFISHPII